MLGLKPGQQVRCDILAGDVERHGAVAAMDLR